MCSGVVVFCLFNTVLSFASANVRVYMCRTRSLYFSTNTKLGSAFLEVFYHFFFFLLSLNVSVFSFKSVSFEK